MTDPSTNPRAAAFPEDDRRQAELLLEIGDAEERGDWPTAARLRRERLTARVAVSRSRFVARP